MHPSRRADVEAELRASILDALEARGASPESEDDVVAVLSQLGEPERMADQYQPNRRYLIGPELFPLFKRVMRVLLVTVVTGSTLGVVVSLLLGGLANIQAGVLLVQMLTLALVTSWPGSSHAGRGSRWAFPWSSLPTSCGW